MKDDREKNKEIARCFYRDLIGHRDESLVDAIIAEDYIQHNPMIKTGKRGVLEAIAYLNQMPVPAKESPSPIRRVIAEADLVAMHLVVEIAGKKKYVMDVFRVAEDKLAEHWDAVQDEPTVSHPARTMIDGPTAIDDLVNTGVNRDVVREFADSILRGGDIARIHEWIDDDLIQHDPAVGEGAAGFLDFLTQPSVIWKTVHRIIVEGNFAVTQSEILIDQEPFVRYDVFRISNRKIIEHWSVQQAIPPRMMHTNGMI